METETRFYHGGPRKLLGSRISPPVRTGAASTASYGAEGVCRRDRVYLTTDIEAAKIYAAMSPDGKGCVYEVRPVGEIEPDPDCKVPGLSYQAKEAIVVSRTKLRPATIKAIRQVMMADAIEEGGIG